ncbi:GNAT family N-acetyltransferase [bacterium]|nr:GNAT family N-acetyltransferase [bacterium]
MKYNQIVFLATILLFPGCFNMFTSAKLYTIKAFKSHEDKINIAPFLSEIEINTFKNYPYIFDSTVEENNDYVHAVLQTKDSVFITAFYNNEPVGIITGASFVDYEPIIPGSNQAFIDAGHNPADFFYCSEVLIVKEHRNKGLMTQLMNALEQYAVDNGYTKMCLSTIVTHIDDAFRPENYREIDSAFLKVGFTKTNMTAPFTWKSFQHNGPSADQEHIMRYWIKDIKYIGRNNE